MKYIRLYEEFQMGDLNFMSPEEIQELFIAEFHKKTPNVELIKVLLENGLVDVNVPAFWMNRTPLHRACEKNSLELAKLLILHGADLNPKDSNQITPLHFLADDNFLELAELLLKSGADVNSKEMWSDTPLKWAKSDEMRNLLIKYGGTA